MKINTKYKNSMLYYSFIRNLFDGDLSYDEFWSKYWNRRGEDLDIDRDSGLSKQYSDKVANLQGNYKIFEEECSDKLYENAWKDNCLEILSEYELAAERMNIRGEWFFMGIWNFIDEYIREYTPSDAPFFDPETDVDEVALARILQAAYDVLTRQKHRWLLKKDGGDIDEDDDPSLYAVDE